jgi:hypothetical protein
MVELNMMEEEFRAHRMAERKRVGYFAMKHEIDREEYKEKREKAQRTNEAYAKGGVRELMKGK